MSRDGLEGAPGWLMLGHGNDGKAEFLQNDGVAPARTGMWCAMSYFDDLAPGRWGKRRN